jgi:hypothetical protein
LGKNKTQPDAAIIVDRLVLILLLGKEGDANNCYGYHSAFAIIWDLVEKLMTRVVLQ